MYQAINRYSIKRGIRQTAFMLIFGLVLLPAQARQDVAKDQFNVRTGGTLFLDVDYASVDVQTHGASEVLVVMEREFEGASRDERKELLSRHEYSFEQDGNDVIVEVRFEEKGDRSWRRWKGDHDVDVHLSITIPTEYNVEFRSGAGDVDIDDLVGFIEGRTGAGNIRIGMTEGSVDVASGAGDVRVRGARGDVYVQSGAGNVTLDDVEGQIEARTGAGNIVATVSRDLAGSSSFDTGAGNVTVYLDERVGADIRAKASLGSARTDYDLLIKGKYMSKSFSGEVNGGGPTITMSAGVGNVSLRRN